MQRKKAKLRVARGEDDEGAAVEEGAQYAERMRRNLGRVLTQEEVQDSILLSQEFRQTLRFAILMNPPSAEDETPRAVEHDMAPQLPQQYMLVTH